MLASGSSEPNLKDLKIIYIKKTGCPYCLKMDNIFKNSNITEDIFENIYDENSKETKNLKKKYNLKYYPGFISLKTLKTQDGSVDTLTELINNLN
jgi:glutaredoxin